MRVVLEIQNRREAILGHSRLDCLPAKTTIDCHAKEISHDYIPTTFLTVFAVLIVNWLLILVLAVFDHQFVSLHSTCFPKDFIKGVLLSHSNLTLVEVMLDDIWTNENISLYEFSHAAAEKSR